jgi:hypothetical protein
VSCATCKKPLPEGRARWCDAQCREGYKATLTEVSKPCEFCGKLFTARDRKLTGVRFERLRFCGNRCAALQKRATGVVVTTKHGMSRCREYGIWISMKARCHNPKAAAFAFYGGRGITVCDQWNASDGFESFYAHVGVAPSLKHTLDRIDNSRGYEPGNVRWATRKEQSRNMRSNRLVTIGQDTRTLAEWIEILGLNNERVWSRLRHGWDPEEAFFAPKMERTAPRRAAGGHHGLIVGGHCGIAVPQIVSKKATRRKAA